MSEESESSSTPTDSEERAAGDVQAVYDRIADHFASTRAYAWPEVESFVTAIADHEGLDRGLDLGCGNGRHTELLAEHGADAISVDVSRGLLSAAATRQRDHGFAADLVQGDAATLPFADDTFGQIVYVATLHHLRPESTRRESLAELGRVLQPGGLALISAWSTAHDRFDAETAFDTTVEWTLPGGETVDRYYHIYDPEAFRAALNAVDAIEPLVVTVSSGNCYAIVTTADSDATPITWPVESIL
ncbi:class I SAM-dependent methyltransferase [Halonotius roseus]|uniref:Class I SAM-dependent methyltransferase n=1 Tax=Halonotius roseus TaxID=2511997 RepID=A0A544QPU9_9EURY|nr:class I SAM-dependent methyltransferase [Halonotius roseus]TQQ81475.1 class I SAM-dependent methyltransferase [Halonotius roseus]